MMARLSILNDPPSLLEGPQLLHDLIQWDQHRESCAIDFTSNGRRQQYSYETVHSCVVSLEARINDCLASESRNNLSSAQHIIPVLVPQSAGLYISQLAILHSGGAFCPINLDAPTERIKFVVGDVSANVIITTSSFKDAVTWENGPAIIIVDEFPSIEQATTPKGGRSHDPTPDDLAYVMYTSGSSGTPKGVAVSHLAASQSLLAHERHIPQFKRFLQFASSSFDVSVFEIFFPLVRGCSLVACNKSELVDDLPGKINELEVDAAELTPTVAGSLLHKRSNAPGLKLLLTIGEMLTTPIVEEFGGSDTKSNMLYGMYGPTEAAIHCTVYPKMPANTKPGNIGIPFDTVSTFIAEASKTASDAANLKFIPIGEIGELILGGPQLARGYLNREDQNKAAFVNFEGRMYYRTGDKARQLEDGTIEMHGRISSGQVKLRGQRVELGEIEEAAYKHPGVKTVSAVIIGSALVVFALAEDENIRPDQVMKTSSKWLPTFMVPSEIVLLPKFPYMPSGKVDKRKLESDYLNARGEEEHDSEVVTDTEKRVRATLVDILGHFSSKTRLAAAGVDSLVAIRIASRLRSQGFNVTTLSVLKAESLKSLVAACKNLSIDSSVSKTRNAVRMDSIALNGQAKDVEITTICTPLQAAMLSETAIDQTAYRNWVEIGLAGITDIEHVESIIRQLAQFNPILRTGFAESQEPAGFVQIIWQDLAASQIERVEKLDFEFAQAKDTSLHRPLRIQLTVSQSGIHLLMHVHHALYDAWSLELLLDDLDSLLRGNDLPNRPPFLDLVDAYADGTLDLNDRELKEYWKDHLSYLDILSMPSFHTGKAPPAGLAVARLQTSIPTSKVEAASKELSVSPQSLFQAAYTLLLGSYLGASDVCFGTVFSGRTLPITGIEDIVGPCLTTLPIRIDVSSTPKLNDLVQMLNSINRKHLENSILPLRDIKSCSGLHSRQPLFDTLLIWQQTLHSYSHQREHVSLLDGVDNLEFNLTLEIIPGPGNVELKANYQQSLFPAFQVDTMLLQLEKLVRAIIDGPSAPTKSAYGNLSYDTLSIENECPITTLKGHTLSSPVERIALEDPERPAVDFAASIEGETLQLHRASYSELNARANKIGHHLSELGVLPDELVCICMEKSVDLYASILASAKVGAGYLPLTPDVPSERFQYILEEANVRFVVASTASRNFFKMIKSARVTYLDELDFSTLPSDNLLNPPLPNNLSYCVFTSGSTGTPKGVMVTRGNLLSNLDVLQDLYPTTERSRFLQSCSQAFDVSVFEIFFAWRTGGCLCSATKDVLFRDIENAIRLLNVTHLSLTPTVAALVDPKNVPSVEFLVTAGEAVTPKVFNAWADRGLWQGYGPSETTNICTVKPLVTAFDAINNIGPPFTNTSAFVLNPGPDFSLVPRGGVGEFCFGGSQVFRGYMDSSQNEGKIIEHPRFGRLYRSGDFGRLLPDGSLAFTGRKDDQVKIRGQRVELGEITSIMLKYREVKDCITLVIGVGDNSQRLVCFWAPAHNLSDDINVLPPASTTLSALYKNIEIALPSYMVPSALIPISKLPSTMQGKIDKRRLAKIFQSLDVTYLDSVSQASKSTDGHNWTELEASIAEAVAMVAKVPVQEIHPETSLYALGIDSISAIALARNIVQRTNHHAEISDILKFSSVVRLAERLLSKNGEAKESSQVPTHTFDSMFDAVFQQSIKERFQNNGIPIESIYPCTPLQEAMLSAAESSSEKLYDNEVLLRINGNIEKLESCWQEMARRHEILRTCFVSTDLPRNPFVQVVLKDFEFKFGKAVCSELKQPLGEYNPPYTIDVVESTGFSSLRIAMHHALYDGVALSVLYEEVESLYQGLSLPRSVSFAPFLQNMISTNIEASENFWAQILRDVRPTRFHNTNKQVSEEQNKVQTRTRIQRTVIGTPLKWIEDKIKIHEASLLAVCHTIWASILSERFQQTDVCFGNVVSGRIVPVNSVERLVAPCFNTIPTRLQNLHNISYLEAFRKLQALNADALPFHLTPLRQIQSKLSPDGLRLFDTLFILQQAQRDLDSSIWTVLNDSGAMDFPLVCEIVPRRSDDTLHIVLHSYTSIFSDQDSESLLKAFEQRLHDALTNPRRQILSASMKEQILAKLDSEQSEEETSDDRQSSKPSSPQELDIRDIISSFTDVPKHKIGREISIFRLGLDSISTVQIATILRKQGYSISASDILHNPTISQLGTFLSQNEVLSPQDAQFDFITFDKQYRDKICEKSGLISESIEAIRPCTAVQQGMLAQTLHSGGKDYVNSMWFELAPDVSVSKLRDAWAIVCQHNEMLRTGFAATEDAKYPFVMVTYGEKSFTLPWSEKGLNIGYEFATPDSLLRQPWTLKNYEEDGSRFIQFTAHHALYDAQSIQLLLSDVAKSYYSRPVGSRPQITTLLGAILCDSQDNVAAKELFWQREENKIVRNHFPDMTPLRVNDISSSVIELSSRALASELDEKCRASGVTMQAAAQAAWARLLSAYTGEASTTFGMTLSGRSIEDHADSTAFPSIVTLPVRCVISGTNAELLERTMNSNASFHKHQFTPLTCIQKWAGFPEGKMFDTLFAYQKVPNHEDGIKLPWKIVREEASVDYAVSLEVQPSAGDKITLRITFRLDLIPAKHAELLLKQYDALLLDTLDNPQNHCGVAPDSETDLLSITAPEERVLPGPVTLLHEFVERGAKTWPGKTALEFASDLKADTFHSETWSYKELDQEANKVAHLLLQRNMVPGDIIAICFDKCPQASFATIGILKAGCAFVALDPNAPAQRLKYIVEDSNAKLVLSAGKPAENLQPLLEKEVVLLDSAGALDTLSSDKPSLEREVDPQDVSYCLYTSGTTGTPKGCLITHENTVQFMLAFSKLFANHWDDDSKYLQFASFHFDVSVMEQFWSWSVGICVASAPRDLIFEDIPGAIRRLAITHIDLTPSLARTLHPDDVPSLCRGAFITGGEQLKQEILDVWGKHAVIYNGYGPTEATIGCTMYCRVPQNGKPANIGPAYINVGSFVLQPGTELPVLRGGIGELCVSGKLVGKGYLNRADLTEERFPTLKAFNERVYRTGDLVRILHDGSFIFLGRADDQVKLRGQRLELSEINEVIKKGMNEIQEVVTLVLKHANQQKEQLASFFVSSSGPEDGRGLIPMIRDACKSRLPGYMVPTHFVPIKALPLNANNKADSKQLAAMYNDLSIEDLQQLSQAVHDDRQWSGKEKKIVEIIAAVIQVDVSALTRGSNIFELGLDSISIIGFSRNLQNAGLDNAKLSIVKNNPSIGRLVTALLEGVATDSDTENAVFAASQYIAAYSQKHIVGICAELGIESSDVEAVIPCTPVQEGMIYRFLESDLPLYFNKFHFHLDGGIDNCKLMTVWEKLVTNIQVLRTKFVATDDGFAQVVLKHAHKASSIEYDTAEKSVALKNPYSFAIRDDSVYLCMFHGLYDGNSLTALLRCVVDEYKGVPSIDYGPPFTSSLSHGPLAKIPGAEEFWVSHLKGWSSSQLSINKSTSPKGIKVSRTIDNLTGFDNLRKKLSVTPQALIQATWVSVLQNISSSNLTIGIVTSGRSIDFEGADKVIGPLFNTIPFHITIKARSKASSLITECHEFNMQMQDFQNTALKEIQKWSPAKTGQGLFDALFVFQRPEAGDEAFADGVWREVEGEVVADYPLAFEATLSPGSEKLEVVIVAQGNVITEEEASELLVRFKALLLDTIESSAENVIDGGLEGDEDVMGVTHDEGINLIDPADEPFTWTEQAQIIRSEISTLANVPEGSIHGNSSIFELGLDSIDVIKLSSRLRKRNIELAVSVIIKSQTISKMAVSVSSKGSVNQVKNTNSLEDMSQALTKFLDSKTKVPQDIEAILPATPLQQSMVNEMINSGYTRYFNVDGFKLSQGIDVERLMRAIQTVIKQSPILRTTFVEIDDPKSAVSYAQIIHRQQDQREISQVTLSEEQRFEAFMEELKSEAISRASNNGLLQMKFVSAGREKYFVIAISHALYDGTSLRSIHEDIQRAYLGNSCPRPGFMPFLEQVFQSTTDDAKKFWKTTLSNLPSATFPKRKLSENENPNTTTRAERKSRVKLRDIEALCRSSRITLQTLGQTCWALVLSQLMGQLDVVFGSVLSCRDTEEAAEVMFPLMNTVAVRSVLHGSIGDMLRYMQEMSDTTRQYQHFPLGTAQAYALASRQEQSGKRDTTLFDTLFIYQGRRSTKNEEALYESVYGVSDVEFPVCVEMEVLNDEHLSWTTACKAVARNAAQTKGIIDALDTVLEQIVSNTKAQTIVSDSDGISVCGLPKFIVLNDHPKQRTREIEREVEAEWSDTEIKIRKALHDISGVEEEKIQKDSTIFHLGLDSILVLKLPALLRTHGIQLSVSDILRVQTISAMGKAAQDSTPDSTEAFDEDAIIQNALLKLDFSAELAKLEQEIGEVQCVLPATAGELYMIRHWQVSQGGMFYQTFTYALHNQLDKKRLEAAWKMLLERHDILRTGFTEKDSNVMQIIFKSPANDIIYRIGNEDPFTRKARKDLKLPPINLVVEESDGPPTILKIVIHHALYDGVSLPILIDELQGLYKGQALQHSTSTFKNFVTHSIAASINTEQKWKHYLSASTSPSRHSTSKTNISTDIRTEIYNPGMKIPPIKHLAKNNGIAVDALFLALLSKLYATHLLSHPKSSNQGSENNDIDHVILGVYLSNRAPFGTDLSSLASPTLNLLPLFISRPLQRDTLDIAREIQRDLGMIGSKEMVNASLEEIHKWTGVKVGCWVNILKDTGDETPTGEEEWIPVRGPGEKKERVAMERNKGMELREEVAYVPAIDIELRFHANTSELDIGLFAPEILVDGIAAEGFIRDFVGGLGAI